MSKNLIHASHGSASAESILPLSLVALAGIVGFGTLGHAMAADIDPGASAATVRVVAAGGAGTVGVGAQAAEGDEDDAILDSGDRGAVVDPDRFDIPESVRRRRIEQSFERQPAGDGTLSDDGAGPLER
ncbi:MAG: hypothetical protein KC417_16215, partial [Myxococcales bacterium]|nr:hypothetical protein [Myxococcales bacterium]